MASKAKATKQAVRSLSPKDTKRIKGGLTATSLTTTSGPHVLDSSSTFNKNNTITAKG
jgi:hypothetical protein